MVQMTCLHRSGYESEYEFIYLFILKNLIVLFVHVNVISQFQKQG